MWHPNIELFWNQSSPNDLKLFWGRLVPYRYHDY